MCGIVGQHNFRGRVDIPQFERMRDSMAHRGPDGYGLWESPDGSTALGHRRLALIDLSDAGRQPMPNEDESLWLVFNGEIYNYQIIRDELEARGHRFRSHTDSEVILHGYEEWGHEVLGRLKGMFAFALWNERNHSFFLARDRFGIKPLYYLHNSQYFLFASEIKGITENDFVYKSIDERSLIDFFIFRYVPSPRSIWQEVSKLPPAHFLEVDADGRVRMKRYWSLNYGNDRKSPREIVARVDELLRRSVDEHRVSDVPVGVFLSGGYDSSALIDYASRIDYKTQAFTIGFSGWSKSEHRYARLVANQFDTPLSTQVLEPEELEIADQLPFFYDEPLADTSVVPTFAVSKLAGQSVKAVMSGEGGDELFGGYVWQHRYKVAAQSHPLRFQWANRFFPRRWTPGVRYYAHGMSSRRFSRKRLRALLHPDLYAAIPSDLNWFYNENFRPDLTPLKSFQHLDVRTFMGELVLTKVDRASMAHSLEVRVPFLDHELHEYLMGIHEDVYFQPDQTKFALRENIAQRMPLEILERPKWGFTGPSDFYANLAWYESVLMSGGLLADGLIRREELERLIRKRKHINLWTITVLELWYSRWAR